MVPEARTTTNPLLGSLALNGPAHLAERNRPLRQEDGPKPFAERAKPRA